MTSLTRRGGCHAVSGASPEPAAHERRIPADGAVGADSRGESSDSWFVELASHSFRQGRPAASPNARASFHAAAAGAGVRYSRGRARPLERRHGYAKAGEVSKLRRSRRRRCIRSSDLSQQAEEPPVTLRIVTAIRVTGPTSRERARAVGPRRQVAVIDTGIDYNHPDLRLLRSWLPLERLPRLRRRCVRQQRQSPGCDADPTTATATARERHHDQRRRQGVAPERQVPRVRVCWLRGRPATSCWLPGGARTDGADVVNMSIGSARVAQSDGEGRRQPRQTRRRRRGVILARALGLYAPPRPASRRASSASRRSTTRTRTSSRSRCRRTAPRSATSPPPVLRRRL